VFFVWQLLAAATGPAEFAWFQGLAGSWLGLTALFGWSLSLFYHLTNGIRHLLWDAGWGFDLATTYRTGQLVVVATLALTATAWIAGIFVWGGR
jgi:succinate dehydrogenase / fumarate reductase cytochrome b subunit